MFLPCQMCNPLAGCRDCPQRSPSTFCLVSRRLEPAVAGARGSVQAKSIAQGCKCRGISHLAMQSATCKVRHIWLHPLQAQESFLDLAAWCPVLRSVPWRGQRGRMLLEPAAAVDKMIEVTWSALVPPAPILQARLWTHAGRSCPCLILHDQYDLIGSS